MSLNKISDAPMTRIDSQIEQLKGMADRLARLTATNVHHARQLGFFEPPKKEPGEIPTPVVSSMEDAINQLQREIDHLDGSMNLFN